MPTKKNEPVSAHRNQKAGVVAYRETNDGKPEILLITARRHPASWIFPVGTVDPGETLEQTAARECAEESGYTVIVDSLVAELELLDDVGAERPQSFSFFLARVTGQCTSYETDRQRRWVALSDLQTIIAEVFAPVAQAAVQAFSSLDQRVQSAHSVNSMIDTKAE